MTLITRRTVLANFAWIGFAGLVRTQPANEEQPNVPSADERIIRGIVKKLTKEPILCIALEGDGNVYVKTGVIRGPLEGGGKFFVFAKRDGKWIVKRKGVWLS